MGRSMCIHSWVVAAATLFTPLSAGAAGLLSLGDFIIAIDNDTAVAGSGYAAAERPAMVIDGNPSNQYRNTGRVGAGFIVTPWVGPTIVTSFTITTASDLDAQDPAGWTLYGTNDPITSADNSSVNPETWSLIASDVITLPTERLTVAPAVTFTNATAYKSYRMVFTAIRGGAAAAAVHVGEIQFDGTVLNEIPFAVLQPADFIIAIDRDMWRPTSAYTRAEFPTNVRDGKTDTKYLNFSKENSGFITTPDAGPTIVRSLKVTSANDAEERDPTSFAIFGTNEPILSQDNSLGTDENWTLIASGALALPATRQAAAPVVAFENSSAYTSYKITFPTVKNQLTANSMQVAEVALYVSTDGTGPNVLGGSGLIVAVNANSGSAFTRAEFPTNIRDGNIQTKYLNFGLAGCGFIVTPSSGPSAVQSITFTTANDHEERDPASYEFYGTNDPVVSIDNSQGKAENWTLVAAGFLSLPAARYTAGPVVSFSNTTLYSSYKLVFPTVKNNVATANSMQIAEIGFFQSLDGSGTNLLVGPMPILAVDPDSASTYPAAENPANVRDGNIATKYLNNGKANTGFITTPSVGATTVHSLVLTTANDASERDPASYALYGTNEPVFSQDNSFGTAENWTLISSGPLALPTARQTVAPTITFENATSYTSYKVVFPTIRNFVTANSMQIAEVALLESADGTGTNVLGGTNSVLGIDLDSSSSYPAGERPENARDGNLLTKYSNSGRLNTGFITTPSRGPTVVQSLKLTTANDAAERDPTSFVLYGTNEPILSTNNTFGNSENWTLIASGPLSLPAARYTAAPVVSFANTTSYASYKLVFPTIKDLAATGMQFSEAALYESADGTGENVIAGAGIIIAIDTDSGSRYPVGQRPANLRDGTALNKYRNTGEENSGLIVTPSVGASVVRSMVLTTANDVPAEDPATYVLYGTNDEIQTLDNGFGIAENWTLIASGDLALPAGRYTVAPVIAIANGTSYTSYKLLFPTVKDAATGAAMHIAELGMFESTDGTGVNLLIGNGPILAIDSDLTVLDSQYPAGQSATSAIDRTLAKYLNFGKLNTGFIVTPSAGPSVVNAIRMVTGEDAVERDPMTWELYGTENTITSTDNSDGAKESWTMIASGATGLSTVRNVSGPLIGFTNGKAYNSYRLVFPTIRTVETANSMQVAEVQFYGKLGLVCPTPFADTDEDGDVDQVDFATFQLCFTGDQVAVAKECGCLDRNNDTHVGSLDLVPFQNCMTGAEIPWTQLLTPECLP